MKKINILGILVLVFIFIIFGTVFGSANIYSGNIPYNNINAIETTNSIKLMHFVTNPYIAPILLTTGFVGFLAELIIPGFGIAGTVSLISFALYFSGNILTGNTGWSAVIIFLAGIILLITGSLHSCFGCSTGGILCVTASYGI